MRRQQRVFREPAVSSMARPAIGPGPSHHPRLDRIALHVSIAREYVARRFDDARTEAAFPKRAGSAVSTVEIRHVTLAELSHQRRATLHIARRQQKMHMVGHQAVRVDGASGDPGKLLE